VSKYFVDRGTHDIGFVFSGHGLVYGFKRGVKRVGL
jgi:hypothetical protein